MSKEYNPEMHTAEHILNAVMTELKGVRSFSNHIEKKKSKCDYRLDSPLTGDEISLIEKRVNEVIDSAVPVTYFEMPAGEAMKKFNMSKLPDPAAENLRIVRIGDFNEYPCIGEHVACTSDIGRFKIASADLNNGALRIRFRLELPG